MHFIQEPWFQLGVPPGYLVGCPLRNGRMGRINDLSATWAVTRVIGASMQSSSSISWKGQCSQFEIYLNISSKQNLNRVRGFCITWPVDLNLGAWRKNPKYPDSSAFYIRDGPHANSTMWSVHPILPCCSSNCIPFLAPSHSLLAVISRSGCNQAGLLAKWFTGCHTDIELGYIVLNSTFRVTYLVSM